MARKIDPTKNVLDLVRAEARYRDQLRRSDRKYEASMRAAETRRVNDLAELRVQYETIIETMRNKALDTTSSLLASQLKETKNDLSDRMAKQEQFRWESGGKGVGITAVFGYLIALAGIAGGIAVAVFK